jgi:hypothetical protein
MPRTATDRDPRPHRSGDGQASGRRPLAAAVGASRSASPADPEPANLRAAGEALIGGGRDAEHVRAVELDTDQAETVLREIAAYIDGPPGMLRAATSFLLRFGDARELVDAPASAARTRPVFELHRMP